MSVVRVTGRINGDMCEFVHEGGDIWTIQAPDSYPNGSYVCEIWAYDDAGNIGYATAILWIYDGRCTKIEWIENPYKIKHLAGGYVTRSIDDGMRMSFIESSLKVTYIQTGYSCHYLRCSEVQG